MGYGPEKLPVAFKKQAPALEPRLINLMSRSLPCDNGANMLPLGLSNVVSKLLKCTSTNSCLLVYVMIGKLWKMWQWFGT